MLEASDHLIASYPDELRHATQDLLRRKNVEILLDTKLTDYNGHYATPGDGRQIATNTMIWTAGIKAAKALDMLRVERASMGRGRVESTLQLPQHPEVFDVGDAAYLVDGNGQALPMLSTVAIQQGKTTAQDILRTIQGKAVAAFHYKEPGLLATIGRNAAVACI